MFACALKRALQANIPETSLLPASPLVGLVKARTSFGETSGNERGDLGERDILSRCDERRCRPERSFLKTSTWYPTEVSSIVVERLTDEQLRTLCRTTSFTCLRDECLCVCTQNERRLNVLPSSLDGYLAIPADCRPRPDRYSRSR